MRTYSRILLYAAILSVLLNPSFACVKNVHITLGDFFVDSKSPTIYRVGFMTERFQDQGCLDNLTVQLDFDEGGSASYKVTAKNEYEFPSKDESNPPSARWAHLRIQRTYGFVDIVSPKNATSFSYKILKGKDTVKGPYKFRSNLINNDKPIKVISFGDHDIFKGMGIVTFLEHEEYDISVLLGDHSYDIQNDDGQVGDNYFEAMEPLLTKAPFIVVPGNHENFDDFKFFLARFIVPGQAEGGNLNRFHFIIQNTLFIGFNFDSMIQTHEDHADHMAYLEKTLERYTGNSAINQRVFFTHRALMCSNSVLEKLSLPNGCKSLIFLFKPIDDLLMKYDVRMHLSCHEHFYERLGPVFNYEMGDNYSYQFIVGTGGKEEILENTYLDKVEYKQAELQQTFGYLEYYLTSDRIHGYFIGVKRGDKLDEFTIYASGVGLNHLVYWIVGLAAVGIIVVCVVLFCFMRKGSDKNETNEVGRELEDKQEEASGLDDTNK